MCKKVQLVYFKERGTEFINICIENQIETYQILKVIDFTSERKCMSVLVKNQDGKIINYIKGADESIAGKLL